MGWGVPEHSGPWGVGWEGCLDLSLSSEGISMGHIFWAQKLGSLALLTLPPSFPLLTLMWALSSHRTGRR